MTCTRFLLIIRSNSQVRLELKSPMIQIRWSSTEKEEAGRFSAPRSALSIITGESVRLDRIWQGRQKLGLLPNTRTAVLSTLARSDDGSAGRSSRRNCLPTFLNGCESQRIWLNRPTLEPPAAIAERKYTGGQVSSLLSTNSSLGSVP